MGEVEKAFAKDGKKEVVEKLKKALKKAKVVKKFSNYAEKKAGGEEVEKAYAEAGKTVEKVGDEKAKAGLQVWVNGVPTGSDPVLTITLSEEELEQAKAAAMAASKKEEEADTKTTKKDAKKSDARNIKKEMITKIKEASASLIF